jgi:hypothetical protein
MPSHYIVAMGYSADGKPGYLTNLVICSLVFGLGPLCAIGRERRPCSIETSPSFVKYCPRIVWCLFTVIFMSLLFVSKTVIRALVSSILLTCISAGTVLCMMRIYDGRAEK